MATSWRISALADRHRALGSNLEDWNGMGTAWTYSSDLADHHEAIRTRAGLMDVSGLKKVHYVGPHAQSLLDWATTRDIGKLYPGKSVYAAILNEEGRFIDDCIVYRTGPNAFMVVHGSGTGYERLVRSAYGRQVAVLFDDDLHDLSLQGPAAVDFLAEYVPGIRDLPYFHHVQTRLFGRPVTISRTGYTGERGYEIFCKAADAPLIWDTILEKGQPLGIIRARSRHSTGCVSKATCCSIRTTTRKCIPSPTKRPATRCGNSASTSLFRRARPNSAARPNTSVSRGASASGFSASRSTRKKPAREATRSGTTAGRSAS